MNSTNFKMYIFTFTRAVTVIILRLAANKTPDAQHLIVEDFMTF